MGKKVRDTTLHNVLKCGGCGEQNQHGSSTEPLDNKTQGEIEVVIVIVVVTVVTSTVVAAARAVLIVVMVMMMTT